jgi:hypothetical protein
VRIRNFGSLGLVLITLVFVLEAAKADDEQPKEQVVEAAKADANEQPKEQVVKFGISADYFTKYIWRGQNVDNKSVFQPAISVSAYGFTGSVWGNMDMTNKSHTAPDDAGEFSEFDWTLDYSGTIPGNNWLGFSIGTIYYRFPNTALKPTDEVYGGLSLPKVPLAPYFKWYRDVDEIRGSYFQFGIGHTVEKVMKWSDNFYCDLALGASIGWGNSAYDKGYFGVNGGVANDFTLTVGLPVTINSWTVKPSFNYSTMLNDSIRRATAKSDNAWFGVGISRTF